MYNGTSRSRQISTIAALSIVMFVGSTFGQSDEVSYAGQKPVEVQIAAQDDSPLTISVTSVDNSGISNQVISLAIQNVSAKPVRGYAMRIGEGASQSTGSLNKILFEPNEVRTDQFHEHRGNIRSGALIVLSIDYVDFVDGSSWGPDTQGHSVRIAGEHVGARSALARIKEIINTSGEAGLRSFLAQGPETASDVHVDLEKPEQWQRGFRNRYKSVFNSVRDINPTDLNSILSLIDKMERVVGRAE